jgi:hypothetical protein
MTRRKKPKTSAKRKISEMISEMAVGFLAVGDTIGKRENRLNAACTAWNMACASPEVRQRQVEQYGAGYRAAVHGVERKIGERCDCQRAVMRERLAVQDVLHEEGTLVTAQPHVL